MKKALVLIGIQNDLITYISQPDYVKVCERLKDIVVNNSFDYVYYYSVFTKDNLCHEGSLGSNVHWKIMELEQNITFKQSRQISKSVETISYPKLEFEENTKVYFAGNLYYIEKAVNSWNIKNYAIIPDCVWVSRLSWPALLSLEDKTIDFFHLENLTQYKLDYLSKYYSNLKTIKSLN